MATLPGAWRSRVSVGTGWPGASMLRLGEIASLICKFYFRVVEAPKLSELKTGCRDVMQPNNNNNNKTQPVPKPRTQKKIEPRLCIRLVGLVVKVSACRSEDPGFDSRLRRDFCGSSLTSDLKIGTPVATLPEAWHYRVMAGTGRPGVNIL